MIYFLNPTDILRRVLSNMNSDCDCLWKESSDSGRNLRWIPPLQVLRLFKNCLIIPSPLMSIKRCFCRFTPETLKSGETSHVIEHATVPHSDTFQWRSSIVAWTHKYIATIYRPNHDFYWVCVFLLEVQICI